MNGGVCNLCGDGRVYYVERAEGVEWERESYGSPAEVLRKHKRESPGIVQLASRLRPWHVLRGTADLSAFGLNNCVPIW